MKNINIVFPILLVCTLGNLLHAQSHAIPAEALWPERVVAEPQYRYRTANESSEGYQWTGVPDIGEAWRPVKQGVVHRTVAEAQTGLPQYQQLWSIAPDGQVVNIQSCSARGDTTTWQYRYNPAGVLTSIVTEGEEAYRYDYEPDTAPLKAMLSAIPLEAEAYPSSDTLLVREAEQGNKHWLIVDNEQRLAEYLLQDKDGKLKQHLQYAYLDTRANNWSYRIKLDRLSTLMERTYAAPTVIAVPEPKNQLQTGLWYAAWGKSPMLYLHPRGRLLWVEAPNREWTKGRWERKGGRLNIQLDNRRQPLVFQEVAEDGASLQLVGDEPEGALPVLQMLEVPVRLREAEQKLALEEWTVYQQGDRVGVRHSADGRQLPAKYDEAKPATADFAIVTLEGLQGLVRYDGQALSPIYFQELNLVAEDLLAGKRDGRYALIRPDGDTVTGYNYEQLITDEFDLRAVKADEMGVIKRTGETVIPFQFDSLSTPVMADMRYAWVDGQMGVVDENGKWVVESGLYLQIVPVGQRTFLIQNLTGQWGMLDQGGKAVVEPQYTHLRALNPSVYVAQLEGRFGLLAADGRELTPLKYQVIKGCEPIAGQGICDALLTNHAVAQYISEGSFGYLDAYGREHPPQLPSAERLAQEYETVLIDGQLEFVFPKDKWRWEPSANRLYKQGDYGRVRVFYEWITPEAQSAEAWLEDNLTASLYQKLQEQEIGGQKAWVATEQQRIRYYDFRKKYAYVPFPDGQLLKLEFSCKTANYLENAQDLYEIEQLLRVNP